MFSGSLLYVPLSPVHHRLGGSALAQCYGQIGDESPDLEDAALFTQAFKVTQQLIAGTNCGLQANIDLKTLSYTELPVNQSIYLSQITFIAPIYPRLTQAQRYTSPNLATVCYRYSISLT